MTQVAQSKQKSIMALITANQKAITSVLPKHLDAKRMMRVTYTVIKTNPKLALCSDISLVNAIIEASMLGLEVGGPLSLAHLLPYGSEAKLIVDYKGFIDLAYRSGRVDFITYHPVYELDEFSFRYGLDPDLVHVPTEAEDPGALVYAYAIVKYPSGKTDFEVVNRRIAMEAKKRSPAKNSSDSPWNKKEDEWTMWCKTAVRRLMKRVPKSPELQRAVSIDEKAEAGVAQNLDHIIEADFTVPQNEESSLEDEIKGSKSKSKAPKQKEKYSESIDCPKDGTKKFTDTCEKKCSKNKECDVYAEWLYNNQLSDMPAEKK